MARAVSEFQSLLSGLASELERKIERAVPALARLDQRELLAFITDAFPDWVTPYLAASGDLTAAWYDEQLPSSDFRAVPAELAPADQLAISARWAMLQADPAVALSGTATRSLFDASRQTVIKNAEVEGVRWARHASANACGFCRMLAIRTVLYRSEETALAVRHTDDEGHNHCHCVAVAIRGGEEYEQPPYAAQWKRDYKAAKESGAKTAGEIANAMDKMPGGRRYKADGAQASTNLDVPQVRTPAAPGKTPHSNTRRPAEARRPEPQGGASGGGRIPPTRFTPRGMDVPDDYPPLPDGSRVPFTPGEAPMATRGDLRRVLYKHRSRATVPNKTLFPRDWSDQDVEDAIELTIRRPSRDVIRGGDKLQFERKIGDVLVRVLIRTDPPGPRFWSAYPVAE